MLIDFVNSRCKVRSIVSQMAGKDVSLKKSLSFSLGFSGNAIEYRASCEKDHLGEVLRKHVAWLKVTVPGERVQRKE